MVSVSSRTHGFEKMFCKLIGTRAMTFTTSPQVLRQRKQPWMFLKHQEGGSPQQVDLKHTSPCSALSANWSNTVVGVVLPSNSLQPHQGSSTP